MTWTCQRDATAVILMVLVFSDAVSVGKADASFSFPSRSTDQNGSDFLFPTGDALNMGDSYRMNAGSVTADGSYAVSCGRVLYGDKIRMVNKISGTVASFNTSFTFSFESNYDMTNPYCGDGMVFAFYPDFSIGDHERSLGGGGFCVHNFSRPNERQFSVEIDSFNNSPDYNDFSDSHISVNFGNDNVSSRHDLCNSTTEAQCATQYNLCTDTIIQTNIAGTGFYDSRCAYFCKGKTMNYTVWIDYDSVGHTLEVIFSNRSLATGEKPAKAMIAVPNLRLNEFLDKEIAMYYVGFTASTGAVREVHTIKSWEFVSTGMPEGSATKRKPISIIASISAAVVAVIIVGFLHFGFIVYRKRRKPLRNQELDSFFKTSDTLRFFTFGELSRSTKNFSASELLSSGTFRDVYRGILPSGELVAVKRIKKIRRMEKRAFSQK